MLAEFIYAKMKFRGQEPQAMPVRVRPVTLDIIMHDVIYFQ